MKSKLWTALRLLVLTVVYFVTLSVAFALVIPGQEGADPAQQATTFLALLVISFLNSLVLAYLVLRSTWAGWKLTLTLSVLIFGITTVMPQIETAIFVSLPAGLLPRLFIAGLLFAVLFSPLAILILGRRRTEDVSQVDSRRLPRSATQWILRLSLIAVVYVVLYFTFGYFIAWQSEAVRTYYNDVDQGNFLSQMYSTLLTKPWLLPFQLLRGLLWTALAIPVIRIMKGKWWEAGLAVALLFSVVMNSQLLLPNPLMPEEVRMMHLLETASSNFIFGWLVVWLLKQA